MCRSTLVLFKLFLVSRSLSLSLKHTKDIDEIYFVLIYGNRKERKRADMSIYIYA